MYRENKYTRITTPFQEKLPKINKLHGNEVVRKNIVILCLT